MAFERKWWEDDHEFIPATRTQTFFVVVNSEYAVSIVDMNNVPDPVFPNRVFGPFSQEGADRWVKQYPTP